MNLNLEKITQISENIQQKILTSQNPAELQKSKKEHLGKGGTISQLFRQIIALNNPEEKKEKISLINE